MTPAFNPSSRAKRHASASADIQTLYRHSTAAAKNSPGSIDARSFAANPPGKTLDRALTDGIDARSLAASPAPNAPRFTIRREVVERAGDRPPRPRRPTHDQSQRTRSSAEENYRGTDNGRARFEDADKLGSPSRSFGGRGTQNPRAPRARMVGSTGERGQRQGKEGDQTRTTSFGRGGGGAGGSISAAERKERQEELKAYLQEREEMLAQKPVVYEPPAAAAGRVDFEGLAPAIASGLGGMKEVLGEETEAARWYAEGRRWIEGKGAWESERQKRKVLGVVQELEAGKEGQDRLLTRLFSGGYITQHPALSNGGKQDALTQVGRLTAGNESYELSDEKALLAKVRSLVAAAPPPPRAGGKPRAQQNVKA